jgi:amino acid transporter
VDMDENSRITIVGLFFVYLLGLGYLLLAARRSLTGCDGRILFALARGLLRRELAAFPESERESRLFAASRHSLRGFRLHLLVLVWAAYSSVVGLNVVNIGLDRSSFDTPWQAFLIRILAIVGPTLIFWLALRRVAAVCVRSQLVRRTPGDPGEVLANGADAR